MKNILIAIADDDTLLANLIADFLNGYKQYKVIFTATSQTDLYAKLKSGTTLPHILLLDLKMHNTNGADTIKNIRLSYPSIKIIVISSYYQVATIGFMFKCGVAAFIPKNVSPLDLRKIIGKVYTQGFYFAVEQMNKMRAQISNKTPKPVFTKDQKLSEREIDILKLISLQKTSKEIGSLLYISPKTVEGHKNNLYLKTGAKNITGLLIYAIQHHIITVEDLSVS